MRTLPVNSCTEVSLRAYSQNRRVITVKRLSARHSTLYPHYYTTKSFLISCFSNIIIKPISSRHFFFNQYVDKGTCLLVGYTISNLFFSETPLLVNHVLLSDSFAMNSSSFKNQRLEVSIFTGMPLSFSSFDNESILCMILKDGK